MKASNGFRPCLDSIGGLYSDFGMGALPYKRMGDELSNLSRMFLKSGFVALLFMVQGVFFFFFSCIFFLLFPPLYCSLKYVDVFSCYGEVVLGFSFDHQTAAGIMTFCM